MGYETQNTDTSSTGGCGCSDNLEWLTQKKTITGFKWDYYIQFGQDFIQKRDKVIQVNRSCLVLKVEPW